MIGKNSLMIGNYVNQIKNGSLIYTEPILLEVESIGDSGINGIPNDHPSTMMTNGYGEPFIDYDAFYHEINPIPITEQRLIDLGFEYKYQKRYFGKEYFLKGLYIYVVDGDFRFYTALNRAWTSYDYVHEIQNLFYVLNGKQLKLKDK